MSAATPDRKRLMGAIHAAAGKLGMDTADKNPSSEYRTMLAALGGASSTTAMDEQALKRVLKHLLQTLNPTKPKDGWHAEKMRQLWAELAKTGALKDPTEQGLVKFVQAQTGLAALRFLSTHQGNRIVETLKAWLSREHAKA